MQSPNVEAVAEFADPNEVLPAGGVTIASPEVPVGGSAGRLFEAIADDTGATLVQLNNNGNPPTMAAGCTIHAHPLSNHPPRQTIDEFVDAFAPQHVIITHQGGRAANQCKGRYDNDVWMTDDTDIYTLLDESGWTAPP